MARRRTTVGLGGIRQQIGNEGTSVSAKPSGTIGVNQQVGDDASVGANVNTQGTIGVGVNQQIGQDTTISATGGYNPSTGNVGAGVGAHQQVGHGSDVSWGVGGGLSTGGVSATGNVQIGDKPGAQTGGQAGGAVGGAIGGAFGPVWGFVGSTAGSLIGSAAGNAFGGASWKIKDHKQRKGVNAAFQEAGFWDANGQFVFPDGSVGQFNNTGGEQGRHAFKNPGKRNDKEDRDFAFGFDTDYTNDTDFVTSMYGISFARLVAGKTNKEIDQNGAIIGNQFLGTVGYGSDFSKENFDKVNANARAFYAKNGIKTKEEMVGLANKAFGEGRLTDSDYNAVLSSANLLYDNDYDAASSLMAGRWKGVETAASGKNPDGTPGEATKSEAFVQPKGSNDPRNRPGRIYSPVVSPEEALMSVKPFFDYYRANARPGQGSRSPSRGAANTIATINGGLGAVSGIMGLIRAIGNTSTGGSLSRAATDLFKEIFDMGGTDDGFNFDLSDPAAAGDTLHQEEPTYDITGGAQLQDPGVGDSSDFDIGGGGDNFTVGGIDTNMDANPAYTISDEELTF